eukprot:CAMPEP_0195523188 /NCGR_PEP_ID=MMETSP0794_2-20130614/22070_1 /TAXON_ID=515487 /ORGANISM="Stephanopyxis turris, Strain CCMP 815" /LENGTH=382 /DNA_ID=CAMNT_0040653109 /DNA_START=178 /DNA_END=1326 /DNA_ORIENTATION=-
MQIDAYKDHSSNQYSGHMGCVDMLQDSIDRLAKRIEMEGKNSQEFPRMRHIADLGSADGSNSMKTLQLAVSALRRSAAAATAPLHITFEEHPDSDEEGLRKVLESNSNWFVKHNLTYSVLMKSFYEPLFEPESLDMIMCYICLHWLDTSDAQGPGGISAWKSLHLGKKESLAMNENAHGSLSDFTFVNETTAPKPLQEIWRADFAKVHLAKFFALRARELKPGAEAVLLMVGLGDGFTLPSKGGPSPLTLAMQRCVNRGLLREKVIQRTIIPYFLRNVDDVKEALDFCGTIEIDNTNPGSLLELVDVRSYPAKVGGGEETLDGTFEMFWAIHSGAVKSAGPTEVELECLRKETRRVFDDIYEPQDVRLTFVACVVRRRTKTR